MSSTIGIPATRVSNMFIRQRLLNQVQADQLDLFSIQTQLNTGKRIQAPSEDPVSAGQIVKLQRLLERKEQVQANLTISQSYMTATDTAMQEVSGIMASIRGTAIGVIDTVSTDMQREAAAQEISQAIQQLMDTGNQKYRGRYLFAGSKTDVLPFEISSTGLVEYVGNEERISSYADIDLLLNTNVTGDEVFGVISEMVEGSEDLNPVLTFNTRLTDLRGGLGISEGSISVSDGTNTSLIDLSSAKTIGEVAALIRANPPAGNSITVEVAADKLVLELGAGTLSVSEVGGGRTADELGILDPGSPGVTLLEGDDLNPVLQLTTPLDDILGTRAYTVVRSSGSDNDLRFEYNAVGAVGNAKDIVFMDDAMAGGEFINWDGTTLTIHVDIGSTSAQDVVNVVQAAGIPITCQVDPIDEVDDGLGLIAVTPGVVLGTTAGGSGTAFDLASGLQITNGGATHTISFTGAATIEEMLNMLNGSDAGVLAEINDDGTGINIRSRVSGADFMIGENGGTTATQLGVRTFTEATRLEDLRFSRGMEFNNGTDFEINLTDGTTLAIDLTTETTIADVLATINAAGGVALQANLSRFGNGIELRDTLGGVNPLSVTQVGNGHAAINLGLVADTEGKVNPPGESIEAGGTYYRGDDVNPQETEGVFTALERLKDALLDNDITDVQRAVDLLDDQMTRFTSVRASVGSRQQGIDSMIYRLVTEDIELRAALSLELDADFVQVVSDLSAKQATFEASLLSTAQILQTSLLNYI